MRPTVLPEAMDLWPGARRVIMSPPDHAGDPAAAPIEAILEEGPAGPLFTLRCVFDSDEMTRVENGAHLWLTFYGHVPVFAATIQ